MPKYRVEVQHTVRAVANYEVEAENPTLARGMVEAEIQNGEFGAPSITITGEKSPELEWNGTARSEVTDVNVIQTPAVKPSVVVKKKAE